MFTALYEDAARTEAKAREGGWTPGGGSFFDFGIDSGDCPTIAKTFHDKAKAVAWVNAAIADRKTVFGAGEVREIEEVAPRDRCRYCICRGQRLVRRWVLDGEGEGEDEIVDDDCRN